MATDGIDATASEPRPDFLVGAIPAADGCPLQYRRYRASEGSPRRDFVLCCIHGIQSHAGWYERSCGHYARRGVETWFFDRRGSGTATVDRGHCRGVGQLVDDLLREVDHVRSQCSGKKVALLAISWGGKLAMAAQKTRPGCSDALVFVAPGWFAKVSPSIREKLAIGWSAWLWPKRLIRIPLNDPALFTSEKRWQEFISNDPHSLRKGTARLFMTSALLDRFIADAPETVDVPSLLQLAGRDAIVDNARLMEYFQRFASKNRLVQEFAEASHTLEFEPNWRACADGVVDFLAEHLSSSAG